MLDTALEKGHIKTGLDVLLFIGAAGSGKSHYKNLCLGLDPPDMRNSTGLSESPVRTMSLIRGAVECKSICDEDKCIVWEEVPPNEYIDIIAETMFKKKIVWEDNCVIKPPLEYSPLDAKFTQAPQDRITEVSHPVPNVTHFKQESRDVVQSTNTHSIGNEEVSAFNSQIRYKSSKLYEQLISKMKSIVKSQKKCGKLLDVDWIYIVDSGGQPQFREMLPTLVQMATACVLTLKLNKPLSKQNEIECFEKGSPLCKTYQSNLTNEQVVKCCSQIVASQTENCKLFAVGTHRDLEHECKEETLSDKNKKLLAMLRPHLGNKLKLYKAGRDPELIYPVNSKTPEATDKKVAEMFRRAVHRITESKVKVDIPLLWFLLELLLHQLAEENKGILSFEACEVEAIRELKIRKEEFPVALNFLTQKLGTTLYFPKLLPRVIFTPQALMTILSKLVRCHHLLRNNQELPQECEVERIEWQEFQEWGIITHRLLKSTIFQSFFSEIFSPNDFVDLMKKLLLVAIISEDAFFLPSVLDEISPEEVNEIVSKCCSTLDPLVVYYSESNSKGHSKENWLPVGSFTSLVGYVQNVCKWLIHDDEARNPVCLHRNCIQFNLPANQPGVVTLVDKYTHLEVYLIIEKAEACGVGSNVRNTILSGLKKVNESLNHTDAVLETGFICSQHKHQRSQIAIVTLIPQLRLVCNNKRTSDQLTEKQTPWFKDEQLLAMAAMPSSQQGMQHQSVTHKERLPTQHQPMHHQPTHHQPTHHHPTQHQPMQRQPMQPQPMQHQPMQYQSMQSQPMRHQPMRHQPMQHQPMQHQPMQPQPMQHQSMQLQPMQPQPMQPQPMQPQPMQHQSMQLQPMQPQPMQPQQIQHQQMQHQPMQPQPMQHQPMQPKQMQHQPMQPQPMQPQPMQHQPMQHQSMQPQPMQSLPMQHQPMPSSREVQQQSMKCKERLPSTEDRPTLPELIDFKTSTGSINIIMCIGTHYDVLGTLLLQDNDGTVTQAIRDQYQRDAEKINREILQRWIQGKGRQPVQWSTLIVVLKKIELSELAKKIEEVLQ